VSTLLSFDLMEEAKEEEEENRTIGLCTFECAYERGRNQRMG
jgi:hypothetical protein